MDRAAEWRPVFPMVFEEIAEGEIGADTFPAFVTDADAFARAAILAICEAGVPAWEGRRAFQRCRQALDAGVTVRTVFRHAGKADAIDSIWRERERLFAAFESAEDRAAALMALPWIGAVTQHRLAQRLGLVRPERAADDAGEQTAGRARKPHGDRAPAARPHGYRRIRPESDAIPLARIGARSWGTRP